MRIWISDFCRSERFHVEDVSDFEEKVLLKRTRPGERKRGRFFRDFRFYNNKNNTQNDVSVIYFILNTNIEIITTRTWNIIVFISFYFYSIFTGLKKSFLE